MKLHVLMNVKYNNDPITTNFEQTNWWITSFTPLKQMPRQNLIDVDIKFSFVETSPHQDLASEFLWTMLNNGFQYIDVSTCNELGFNFQLLY